MRSLMERHRRRVGAAAVAGVLAVAGLATAPAAAAQTPPYPSVGDVTAAVTREAPLWSLKIHIPLNNVAPMCAATGATLYYRVGPFASLAAEICAPGRSALPAIDVYHPVFKLVDGVYAALEPSVPGHPAKQAPVQTWIGPPNQTPPVNPSSQAGGQADLFPTPTAPVWVGMGDGFTSQAYQDQDGYYEDPFLYDPNMEFGPGGFPFSWVHVAVAERNVAVEGSWRIKSVVVAQDGATAADLATADVPVTPSWKTAMGLSETAEVDPMNQVEAAAAVLERYKGSWNWVGLSAGLVEAQIPQTIGDWYADTGVVGSGDEGWATTPAPWEIPTDQPGLCPDFSAVNDAMDNWFGGAGAAATDPNSVRSDLQAVVDALSGAGGVDPTSHLVQFKYPYLTNGTEPMYGYQVDEPYGIYEREETYDNPCDLAGQEKLGDPTIIDRLNQAVAVADAIPVELDLAFTKPMGDLFLDDFDPEWIQRWRENNDLQTTRPFGYPYPSPRGRNTMAGEFNEVVDENLPDHTKPVVVGTRRSADWGDSTRGEWWNHPVPITWSAYDEPGGSGLQDEAFWALPPTSLADKQFSPFNWPAPRDAVDNARNRSNPASVPLRTDFDPPVVDVNGTAVTPGTAPAAVDGWFRGDVRVAWSFVNDNLSGVDAATRYDPQTYSAEGIYTVVNPVPVYPENSALNGKRLNGTAPQAATMCDIAGNCSAKPYTVRIDRTAPTPSPTFTPADPGAPAPVGDWFGGPVAVDWGLTDVPGLGAAPGTATSGVSTTAGDPHTEVFGGGVPAQSGEFVVNRVFYDVAGNRRDASTTVKIDRAGPETIDVFGMPEGVETGGKVEISDGLPTPTCTAFDSQVGIDPAFGTGGCLVEKVSGEGLGEHVFLITATDLLGNTSTKTVSYLAVDEVPPTLDVTYQREGVEVTVPGSGWFRAAVDLFWVAEDTEPGSGFGNGEFIWTKLETANHEGTQEYSQTVADVAGNTVSGARTVKIDSRSPDWLAFVGPEGSEEPWSADRWFNHDVRVRWQLDGDPVPPGAVGAVGAEQASGEDETSDDAAVSTATGTGPIANPDNTLCDIAGNCADAPVQINIDRIHPTATATVTGEQKRPGSNWYQGTVAIAWEATDEGDSGLAGSPTANDDWDTPGQHEVPSPTFVDNAGNEYATFAEVWIDNEAPVVTIGGIPDAGDDPDLGGPVFADPGPTPTCEATDDLSGVDAEECFLEITEEITDDGAHRKVTVTVRAMDRAGNESDPVTTTYFIELDTAPPVVVGTPDRSIDGKDVGDLADRHFGWHREPVNIEWVASDPAPSAGLPDEAANLPDSVATEEGFKVRYDGPTVTDNAGKKSAPAAVYISLDRTDPTVSLTGVTAGGVYTSDAAPVPDCLGSDDLSGFDRCQVVTVSRADLPDFGPPGYTRTIRAVAYDNAGNSSTSAPLTYTVLELEDNESGRMTGGASVANVSASFTLRCNGSPNQLKLSWPGGSFDMDHVDAIYCWDGEGYGEGQPDAPIDSLHLVGTGKLKNGKAATVEITLTDRGEPGKGSDTMRVVVKEGSTVRASAAGFSTDKSGNVQAHASQGNGTNDNGNVNGPNGARRR